MTPLDTILAKYITRETHKGSVNRIRQLMKEELLVLIDEAYQKGYDGCLREHGAIFKEQV